MSDSALLLCYSFGLPCSHSWVQRTSRCWFSPSRRKRIQIQSSIKTSSRQEEVLMWPKEWICDGFCQHKLPDRADQKDEFLTPYPQRHRTRKNKHGEEYVMKQDSAKYSHSGDKPSYPALCNIQHGEHRHVNGGRNIIEAKKSKTRRRWDSG